MRTDDWESVPGYDALLNELVRLKDGEAAFEFYTHHPSQLFPRRFNAVTRGVDGRGIGPVYANVRRVLVRRVRGGTVADGRHLHRVAVTALDWLVLHHGTLTWCRDHPRVPGANGTGGDPRPLFTDGVDVGGVAGPAADPNDELIDREALAGILREARRIGLLHVRAVQIYRRYEFTYGKTHGAYVHLARYAVVRDGTVVGFRPWRAEIAPGTTPERTVVRQVRRIHLEACDRVCEAARRLGFEPPPGP